MKTDLYTKTILRPISFIIIVLLIASSIYASPSDSDVKNATKFMNEGMYPQAIALWDKVVKENPKDASSFFQLGICHLHLYDFESADGNFAEAIRLKHDYGYKVGDEYKKIACKLAVVGNYVDAEAYYQKAIQYQPSLEVGIENLCEIEINTVINRLKKKAEEDTSVRTGELIDIYRVEIAYQVHKNWAVPEHLAGGRTDLQTLLVFKVMPNGEIRDLFFTDPSGNSPFDESAYQAIMRSNPVDPHPAGIIRPYVQMGLRFTPEGIK